MESGSKYKFSIYIIHFQSFALRDEKRKKEMIAYIKFREDTQNKNIRL